MLAHLSKELGIMKSLEIMCLCVCELKRMCACACKEQTELTPRISGSLSAYFAAMLLPSSFTRSLI